jgi:hypothetical protein
MFDRHGSLDVLLDCDWLNLVLSQHSSGIEAYNDVKSLEITGASFNTLLLGIIIYHGYLKPSTEELFGGTKVWGLMMEHVLCTLPTTATVPEVMVRILFILQGFLLEVHGAEELVKAHLSRSEKHNRHPLDLSNLWYGAINFLKFWISEYAEYFTDLQIRELEQGILDMCKRLNAAERVKNLSFHEGEIDKSTRNIALIDMTAHMCMKLRHQVGSIGQARSWHSMGFSPPALLGHLFARADVGLVLPFSHITPSIPQLEGNWAGDQKEKNKKKALAAAAGSKDLGVFGGASALANYDSSDSDGEPVDPNDATQSDSTLLEVRVPKGFDLKGRDKVEFWSLDSLELARQWTLADHKLFQAIQPCNLLSRTSGTARSSLGKQNTLRFIDRFNCVSNWATSSILTGRTPENRASIYEYILKIAHHFRNLHNFHSLMALLTGLQRGCISRLANTLALVSQKSKEDLTRLLQDMNGSKNYSAYRRILDKFMSPKSSALGAFIPHLGAHLAEITSVDEGNTDYISNAPHLLNVVKLKLLARTVMQLADLQKFRYNLTPVRIVSCAIDKALQPFVHLTKTEVSENDRKMFDLSLEREPNKLAPKVHVQTPRGDSESSSSGSSSGSDSGGGDDGENA